MNSAFLHLKVTQDELCCWFMCTYSVSCFQVSCAVRGEYASSSSESAWGHEHGTWKPKYHWGVRCCSLPWYYRHITGVQYVKKGRTCSQITQVRSPFNISCWSEFILKTICKIPWECFPWTRLSSTSALIVSCKKLTCSQLFTTASMHLQVLFVTPFELYDVLTFLDIVFA